MPVSRTAAVEMAWWRRAMPYWPLYLLLFVLSLIWAQTLDFPLSFDDQALFGDGIAPTSGSLGEVFYTDYWGIAVTPDAPAQSPYYRPVAAAFIVFERTVLADTALIRATHALLFLISLVLLFNLIQSLSRAVRPIHAALGTAFFAFSPIVPDAVLLLSGVCDLLALVFILTALRLAIGWHRNGGYVRGLACVFAVLLAMLSKEIAYPMPVLLAGLFFLSDERGSRRPWWILTAGAVGLLAAVLVVRASVVSSQLHVDGVGRLVQAAGTSILTAIRYTVAPYPSLLEVSVSPSPLTAVSGFLLLLLVAGLVWRARAFAGLLAMGVLFFFCTLTPAIIATAVAGRFAPRYLAVPLAGGAMAVAFVCERLLSTHITPRRVCALQAGLALLLVLSAGAMLDRVVTWKDGVTLFTNEIQRNPTSLTGHINLANKLAEAGRYPEALVLQRRAIALAIEKNDPCAEVSARLNAAALLETVRPFEAAQLLRQGLGRCPRLDHVIDARLRAHSP